ncbi:retropepsin-like aspartic protease [Dyadobacter subterraneus]|uniref:Clan AA aspartic protease n=1 Tax=Dyadobacter subterraneus TaxID=2773304 RepID=A0ABR9WA32_9BACT|nr:retropepsin-like aspartic protease [Dyadobacter subterraneus]MBE9462320.1 clan AA aspartic protease [Dyadobacter subterraneus]
MKSISFKIILIAIWGMTSISAHAQTSIPFEIAPSGHITIKAIVNGIEGNFILDTGAGLTLLTKKFSSKMANVQKLNREYTAFRATGEKITADLYTTDQIMIGDFKDPGPTMMIFDVELGPFDGLISLMSFKNQPFTVDYDQKKLIIETPGSFKIRKTKGNILPLQIESSRDITLDIFTFVQVNKKLTLQFLVDSGAGANVFHINAKHLQELGVDVSDTSKVIKRTRKSEFNKDIETSIYSTNVAEIAAKDFPQIHVNEPKVLFIEGLIYDGTSSLNWFGKQITIDVSGKQMIVGK